ncbi:hypothetical protein HMI54_006545 [Coelomomyces lativittatus]|nr:hypothetical protein HMI56_002693 [Coelomomyces lativittatus]KAJ1504839.1 hypothetical protein HMI54_006545 [Coelomomyces lativittatus]KAJ1505944.1 hypothetical protein HMI55_001392 [Coelomomyces lativittatus]
MATSQTQLFTSALKSDSIVHASSTSSNEIDEGEFEIVCHRRQRKANRQGKQKSENEHSKTSSDKQSITKPGGHSSQAKAKYSSSPSSSLSSSSSSSTSLSPSKSPLSPRSSSSSSSSPSSHTPKSKPSPSITKPHSTPFSGSTPPEVNSQSSKPVWELSPSSSATAWGGHGLISKSTSKTSELKSSNENKINGTHSNVSSPRSSSTRPSTPATLTEESSSNTFIKINGTADSPSSSPPSSLSSSLSPSPSPSPSPVSLTTPKKGKKNWAALTLPDKPARSNSGYRDKKQGGRRSSKNNVYSDSEKATILSSNSSSLPPKKHYSQQQREGGHRLSRNDKHHERSTSNSTSTSTSSIQIQTEPQHTFHSSAVPLGVTFETSSNLESADVTSTLLKEEGSVRNVNGIVNGLNSESSMLSTNGPITDSDELATLTSPSTSVVSTSASETLTSPTLTSSNIPSSHPPNMISKYTQHPVVSREKRNKFLNYPYHHHVHSQYTSYPSQVSHVTYPYYSNSSPHNGAFINENGGTSHLLRTSSHHRTSSSSSPSAHTNGVTGPMNRPSYRPLPYSSYPPHPSYTPPAMHRHAPHAPHGTSNGVYSARSSAMGSLHVSNHSTKPNLGSPSPSSATASVTPSTNANTTSTLSPSGTHYRPSPTYTTYRPSSHGNFTSTSSFRSHGPYAARYGGGPTFPSISTSTSSPHSSSIGYAYFPVPVTSMTYPPSSIAHRNVHPITDKVTLKKCLQAQIEYYFSVENLCKDIYIRQHMDPCGGWVALSFLASFNRVKLLTDDVEVMKEALISSKVIELDPLHPRVRREGDWSRWLLPSTSSTTSPTVSLEETHEKQNGVLSTVDFSLASSTVPPVNESSFLSSPPTSSSHASLSVSSHEMTAFTSSLGKPATHSAAESVVHEEVCGNTSDIAAVAS